MTDEANRKGEESLRVFSQAASIYDRIGPPIFAHFGQRLVDLAEMAPGSRVLDVAAGRGAVLIPAAAKVGTTGHVIGIDFSPEMVRETAKDIESQTLRHAEIRQLDAEAMDFSDASFDWVLCGFALWMFAHPGRVLREFCRVLKPGGSVGLSTWSADNPFHTWCYEALRPYAPAPGPNVLGVKDDSKFDTPLQLQLALEQAGFTEIQITVEEKDFIYESEEKFWLSLWTAGIRRRLEKMTPAAVEQAKNAVFQKLRAMKKPDGYHKLNRALFAFGTKRAI